MKIFRMKIDQRIFKDIRFWLILFFLVRLVHITYPPLETQHSWRQTTVLMPARNFYETDANILYPRVDFAGEKSGITGMEFPVFNYLIYLVSLVFGYAHWYGRLINLIVSTIGCWYFYKLILSFFDKKIAFNATILLTFSIWFAYSRKIMPDTFATSLVITGIYHGINYLKNKPLYKLILYFLLTLTGILAKIHTGYLLAIFIFPFIRTDIHLNRKIALAGTTVMLLIPVYTWYFYWVPYLFEQYDFQHFFMGMSMKKGLKEIGENLPETLKRFHRSAMMLSGFLMFIAGLIIAIIKKNKTLLLLFIISFLSFMPALLKTGHKFAYHNYYIIPFVPILALVAGYGISQVRLQWLYLVILISICLENVLNTWTEFSPRKERWELMKLEKIMDQFSERNDLVAINGGDDPTALYLAHRRGWRTSNKKLNRQDYLDDLKNKGCKYILILKIANGKDTDLDLENIYEDENFKIYRM